MREDWRLTTVGQVCEIVNGGTPKTNIAAYWGGHHLWITPAEMGKRLNPYVAETARKLTDIGLSDCSARLLPTLSVILSSRAPIGHLVINTAPMATNQGCKGLVPSKSLDHKFLFYYLSSIIDLLNDLGVGATFKELSGGKLKEVPLPLPPFREQKRIVAILDEAFEGIDAAVANAEKNLANARELFETYLTAILKKNGDQWIEKSLGSVCDLSQGLAINKGTKHLLVSHSKLPLLRIKDLRDGTAEQYVAETGFPKNAEIFPQDIVYTRTGQIGLVFRGRRGVLHNNSFKIVPQSELDRGYLFWWLQEPMFRQRIVALASRAAQPDITHKLFQSERISIPPMDYQRDAVEKIEKLYADTQSLSTLYQQKISGLVALKETVLRKAFSGRLTLRSESVRQEAAE